MWPAGAATAFFVTETLERDQNRADEMRRALAGLRRASGRLRRAEARARPMLEPRDFRAPPRRGAPGSGRAGTGSGRGRLGRWPGGGCDHRGRGLGRRAAGRRDCGGGPGTAGAAGSPRGVALGPASDASPSGARWSSWRWPTCGRRRGWPSRCGAGAGGRLPPGGLQARAVRRGLRGRGVLGQRARHGALAGAGG